MSKKNKPSQFPKGPKPGANSESIAKESSSENNSKPNYIYAPLTTNSPTSSSEKKSAILQPEQITTTSPNSEKKSAILQPEQMSLTAYQHIQKYLEIAKKTDMEKEDLNAVLRLSQHLRLFGLLSAVGYVNQSNAQEGKVRDRTVPVWISLLGQMLGQPTDAKDPNQRRNLMESVAEMARNQPAQYMANWRKSMMLSEQWNFWARAYSKGE